MARSPAHDEAAIKATRKRRERRLREEQRSEWDRFESLTRTLVHTPKDNPRKAS